MRLYIATGPDSESILIRYPWIEVYQHQKPANTNFITANLFISSVN